MHRRTQKVFQLESDVETAMCSTATWNRWTKAHAAIVPTTTTTFGSALLGPTRHGTDDFAPLRTVVQDASTSTVSLAGVRATSAPYIDGALFLFEYPLWWHVSGPGSLFLSIGRSSSWNFIPGGTVMWTVVFSIFVLAWWALGWNRLFVLSCILGVGHFVEGYLTFRLGWKSW